MPDSLNGASFWPLFAFFASIAFLRTLATYWIARLVSTWTVERTHTERAWVRRVQGWLGGPGAARGRRALERWGLVAVPASFLMSGTKTIVNGAAGILRVPFGRYLAVMALGCVLHGTIYATVGWAAWTAALAAATGSPAGIAVLVLIVVLIALAVVLHRRHSRAAGATLGAVPPGAQAEHEAATQAAPVQAPPAQEDGSTT
ncbi:DedA family protein [Paraoerskovia marina]|uniref:DedA family protein n=1 Tax=Paraoerskovia marina TaxID=545619 RepID=UPI0012DCC434|nr:hypothetical protein [Paraoerskovia marina]